MYEYETLEHICKMSKERLFKYLKKTYKNKVACEKGKYILVPGTAPIMLLAHLDTVHKQVVQTICYSEDKNIIMSPQGIGGDDRCGVYALMKLYHDSPIKPWLLFTCDEEIGGIGAKAFAKDYKGKKLPDLSHLKFLVEIDRKGNNDCVFYDLDNPDFEKYVESKGFKTDWGSYTDICDVAPAVGCAAVNLSSGYYNAHTQHEYINKKHLESTINNVKVMIADSIKESMSKYEWIEAIKYTTKKNYGVYSGFGGCWGDNYDSNYWKKYHKEIGIKTKTKLISDSEDASLYYLINRLDDTTMFMAEELHDRAGYTWEELVDIDIDDRGAGIENLYYEEYEYMYFEDIDALK